MNAHVTPPDHAVAALCVAVEHGDACRRDAEMVEPVPLCPRHKVVVAQALLGDLLGAALDEVQIAERARIIGPVAPVPLSTCMNGQHDPVVYFLVNGNRIKIGYTTNLSARLAAFALRSSSIALLLAGDQQLEKQLHLQFAAYRIERTEWFDHSSAIERFIAGIPHPANEPVMRPTPRLPKGDMGAPSDLRFPDGTHVSLRRLPLWEALGRPEGTTLNELVALDLDGYKARTSVDGPIQRWRSRGWVHVVGTRGRAQVFAWKAAGESDVA